MGWEGNMRDTIQCIKENIKGCENGTVGYADCYSDLFDAITEVEYSFPHWYTEEQKEKEAECFGYAGLYDRKNDCLTLPEPLPVDMDANTEALKNRVRLYEKVMESVAKMLEGYGHELTYYLSDFDGRVARDRLEGLAYLLRAHKMDDEQVGIALADG